MNKFGGWNKKEPQDRYTRVLVTIPPKFLETMDDFAITHELSRADLIRRSVELYMEVENSKYE